MALESQADDPENSHAQCNRDNVWPTDQFDCDNDCIFW